MPCAALILVETSMAGNLGAAIRVAANFGVPRIHLVRCRVDLDDPEVWRWSCGGEEQLEVCEHPSLDSAAAGLRTLVATASGRGRENQPLISPRDAVAYLRPRGLDATGLVFGNETSGLRRDDLDRCDLAVRLPTAPRFPVLNVTQAVAILLAHLSMEVEPQVDEAPQPAPTPQVEGLMGHLRQTLLGIGFLDPRNPERVLRKLRRMFGRAGITENEVGILRGICRQVEWAARAAPLREAPEGGAMMDDNGQHEMPEHDQDRGRTP